MRIVHLAAGAAGMYCGACARDAALARGLIARGHDVEMIPLYTPLRVEGPDDLHMTPVFLGGINAYLQQVSPLFRRTPRWLDRTFDSPALLRWVSRFAVRTDPRDLGPMTVSVLRGRDGMQRKEVERLLRYLAAGPRPDIVSITNSLLSGIAPALKSELGVPVACGLQGEESFVAGLPDRFREQAQEAMRANARSFDLFLSPGEAYAEEMASFLDVPRDRIALVRAGIDPAPYARPSSGASRRLLPSGAKDDDGASTAVDPNTSRRSDDGTATDPLAPRGERGGAQRRGAGATLAYLGVINPAKGLDRLIEATSALVQAGHDVRLRVAGKPLDPSFLRQVQRQVEAAGLRDRVEFLGEVDLAAKVRLLQSSDVYVTPTRIAESRGVAAMEALAAGVPVVAPASGIFPEMAALTGGIALYEESSVEQMTAAIAALRDDPARAAEIGCAGRDGIERHFHASVMVEAALAAYASIVEKPAGVAG